ncbi:hypothetical protein HN958_02590 [Candidatus Falkowbacteria bacterium]|nr:hypothetical protein [Candidatus Falkowbacteria bacterium]
MKYTITILIMLIFLTGCTTTDQPITNASPEPVDQEICNASCQNEECSNLECSKLFCSCGDCEEAVEECE